MMGGYQSHRGPDSGVQAEGGCTYETIDKVLTDPVFPLDLWVDPTLDRPTMLTHLSSDQGLKNVLIQTWISDFMVCRERTPTEDDDVHNRMVVDSRVHPSLKTVVESPPRFPSFPSSWLEHIRTRCGPHWFFQVSMKTCARHHWRCQCWSFQRFTTVTNPRSDGVNLIRRIRNRGVLGAWVRVSSQYIGILLE
jgi:hypothetical protein